MARGNQTFKTTFLLDAKQFKAGVKEIQGSLKSLKGSFMDFSSAIGVGLGMVSLISNLKDTAVKLSVAQNTLKNVSYETLKYEDATLKADITLSKYKENLEFVKRLSDKYGQSIIALTHEFAQFTAAANGLGMSLDDQKRIYESLVRASATFHMSEDKTRDMIVAVTQMMSKGKVTAEELRRQLGNHLPGAFNLMAKAAGNAKITANGTTAELEELMKKGDAIAKDLLPVFAAELDKLTQNAHFDSLQTSLNRFGNAWVEFTQSTGFEGMFTKLVNTGISALQVLTNNFNAFVWAAIGAFSTKLVMGMVRGYNTLIQKGEDWYNTQMAQLKKYEKEAEILKEKIDFATNFDSPSPDANKGLVQTVVDYNNALIRQKEIRLQIDTLTGKEKVKLQAQIAALRQQNTELIECHQLSQNTGRSFSTWQKLLKGARVAINGIKGALLSMGITAIVSALVGLIAKVSAKIKESREEWERIKGIAKGYTDETAKVKGAVDAQTSTLRMNLAIVKDTTKKEAERLNALKEVNKTLGLTGDNELLLSDLDKIVGKYDKITNAVEEWCKATAKQALVQHYANQIAEITANKAEAKRKQDEAWSVWAAWEAGDVGIVKGSKAKQEWQRLNAEIAQYDKALKTAEADMLAAGIELNKIMTNINQNTGGNSSGGDDGKGKKTRTLADIYADYLKQEKELANQLKEGAITQSEYDEAFEKFVTSFYKEAAGTGTLSLDNLTKKLADGKTLTKMQQWYYDLAGLAKEAALSMSMRESNKIIEKALKESDKEWNDFLEKQKKKKADLEKEIANGEYNGGGLPEDRDTLFDYSKSNYDVFSEAEKIYRDWYNDVKSLYDKLISDSEDVVDCYGPIMDELDRLSEEMEIAKVSADSLAAAMNFAKVQEDIKSVKKEMNNLVYSGIKDFATSMDRVISAAETLKETMNDADASGWEKFMAIFNMITQVIDSAMAVYSTITTIQELSAKLGAAKIAEQTALNALLKEELALRMAAQGLSDAEIASRLEGIGALIAEKGLLAGLLGLKQAEATQTATNTALKGAEAAASMTAAGASSAEAIAGATASGSKMPFPYNLIAIAAGVAAVVAALASMSKFEKGGIVGGNSTHGDHNLVRANSGEMILTKGQQGTLFNMLNGKGGIGGNVEFKIKGSDLVGTINNYSKKISK